MFQEFIDKLSNKFPGYHLEIEIYPKGGKIIASSCEECGTKNGMYISAWKCGEKVQSLDDAIVDLKGMFMTVAS